MDHRRQRIRDAGRRDPRVIHGRFLSGFITGAIVLPFLSWPVQEYLCPLFWPHLLELVRSLLS